MIDCDFDNPKATCPRCGFKARESHWRMNCPLGSGLPVPGTRLRIALKQLGAQPKNGCNCHEYARKMDAWGVEKCREHRAEIVEHLRKAYKGTSWPELAAAMAKSVTTGLAFKLNPFDPFPSLVDEAIRRAEAAKSATVTKSDRTDSPLRPAQAVR